MDDVDFDAVENGKRRRNGKKQIEKTVTTVGCNIRGIANLVSNNLDSVDRDKAEKIVTFLRNQIEALNKELEIVMAGMPDAEQEFSFEMELKSVQRPKNIVMRTTITDNAELSIGDETISPYDERGNWIAPEGKLAGTRGKVVVRGTSAATKGRKPKETYTPDNNSDIDFLEE